MVLIYSAQIVNNTYYFAPRKKVKEIDILSYAYICFFKDLCLFHRKHFGASKLKFN